jgi:hypothetical protein
MISFKQFVSEGKLTPLGRFKKRRTVQRYRYKLKRRANIATGISASTRRLKRRSYLAARRTLYKKLLGLKNKGKLSSTQKAEAERIMKRKGKSYLKPLSTRLQPKMRRLDTKRLGKAHRDYK